MKEKETFYKTKEACSTPFTHIMDDVTEPSLQKIDELYGAADVLSLQSAERYRRTLLAMSTVGTLLAIAFLLYDEVYLSGMIIACGVLVLVLFYMNRQAVRLQCHKNYLEYRLLAEGARVQFFLYKAGIRINVADLLPWSWQFNVPWTAEVLREAGSGEQEENMASD